MAGQPKRLRTGIRWLMHWTTAGLQAGLTAAMCSHVSPTSYMGHVVMAVPSCSNGQAPRSDRTRLLLVDAEQAPHARQSGLPPPSAVWLLSLSW